MITLLERPGEKFTAHYYLYDARQKPLARVHSWRLGSGAQAELEALKSAPTEKKQREILLSWGCELL